MSIKRKRKPTFLFMSDTRARHNIHFTCSLAVGHKYQITWNFNLFLTARNFNLFQSARRLVFVESLIRYMNNVGLANINYKDTKTKRSSRCWLKPGFRAKSLSLVSIPEGSTSYFSLQYQYIIKQTCGENIEYQLRVSVLMFHYILRAANHPERKVNSFDHCQLHQKCKQIIVNHEKSFYF